MFRGKVVVEQLEQRTLMSTVTEETGLDPVMGDANGDLKVDQLDLSILANNWGATDATWAQGDFSGNGTIDIPDLLFLAANMGYDGTAVEPPAPEPVLGAPIMSGLPDITLSQGTTLNNETDIWAFTTDDTKADHLMYYTIINDTNQAAGVTLDQNRWFDIRPPAGFTGSTDITVQVSDGVYTDTDTFTVTVEPAATVPTPDPEPVVGAPVMSGLPNITLVQGTTLNNETDIWAFTTDDTKPDHEMYYTIINDTNPSAGVTLDQNRWFDIRPPAGFTGSTDITVQVSDGVYTDTDTFTVTVTPAASQPDAGPIMSGLPNISLDQGTSLTSQTDLWAYTADADTADNDLVFSIIGDTNPQVGVTLNQNRWFNINPSSSFTGSTDITVQVTDGVRTATDTFRVTVYLANVGGSNPGVPSDLIGSRNMTFIDIDGDGYGVAASRGADADDYDATVNTSSSMLAKYGSLKNFLTEVKGYDVNRIFYISRSGNNSTAQVDNPNRPYGSWAGIHGDQSNPLQPGDVIVWRGGKYGESLNTKQLGGGYIVQGSADQPIVFMAYPGETVTLDTPENTIHVGGTFGRGPNNYVFDGFTVDNTTAREKGRGILVEGKYQGQAKGITFKNMLIQNYFWGMIANHDVHDITMESSVIRSNGGEHGLYWSGKSGIYNTNLTVRGNVIYDNAMQGFYHNGPVTNLLLENNIIHSNGTVGIELINGVKDSVFRNNLVFNNAKEAVVIYNYRSPQSNILPFDQTNNLFVNNTFWVGRYSSTGSTSTNSAAAILFNDSAGGNSFDHNIFRNNIIVTQSGPAFKFYQANYLDTTVIENNVIYGVNGGATLYYAGTNYSASQFESFSSLIRNNSYSDPKFVNVSTSYYNNQELFNFDLLNSSPAVDLGIWTDAPEFDLLGDARMNLPDAGSYEA